MKIQAIFILLSLCLPLTLAAEVPSEMGIGVPPFSAEENLLSGSSVATRTVLSAVSAPLLVAREATVKSPSLFSLVLADSFQVDSSLTTWSYRVRDATVFANGQFLRGSDICNSLKSCAAFQSSEGTGLVSCEVRTVQSGEARREWIDLRFDASLNNHNLQAGVVKKISHCPVVETTTRELFGMDYGIGANITGAGDYRLAGFQAGKSWRLERYQRSRDGRSIPPQRIDVISYARMTDALAALRVGNIALFFNNDEEVAATASNDETLRSATCGGEQVIYRRGFHFECADTLKLSSINWQLP